MSGIICLSMFPLPRRCQFSEENHQRKSSHTGQKLNDFTPVTPAEVTKLLNSMSSKSSPLDYVSTSLLKSCASTFSILISHLANLSFDQAAFPSKFKHALITPLLKKPGLSKSDPSNFRSISNLNTIGKILERLALARLLPHLSISPSFSPFSRHIESSILQKQLCSN